MSRTNRGETRAGTEEISNVELRLLAKKSVKEIFENGLFGCRSPAPHGTLRGIDVMPRNVFTQKLSRAAKIYYGGYRQIPDFLAPQGFYEKLCLAKVFAPIPMPSPADKLSVERYIPNRLKTRVKPVRVVWSSVYPITEDALNAAKISGGRYYAKLNSGAGSMQKVTLPLAPDDAASLSDQSARWLDSTHGTKAGEWWYWLIGKRVFLEEDLSKVGTSLTDWKFHVGGGKVLAIQLDLDRHSNHKQLIFDREFRFINEELFFRTSDPIDKPDFVDEMVEIAEEIGGQFEFARVDLYQNENQIHLGEITLCPMGGLKVPKSFNLNNRMGGLWRSKLFEL